MDDESDTTIDSDEEFENDNFSEPVIRRPINNISQNATPIDAVFLQLENFHKKFKKNFFIWLGSACLVWHGTFLS